MKLMIASDLHGSAKYCRLLLEALNRENPDKLLLLGDLLYHGPRNDLPEEYAPKQVIAMLSGVKDKVLCVRGNCDTEVDQMVLPFPILADYCWLYLDGHAVFATHGHHHCEAQPPALQPGDILLCGHTHVPACRVHDQFTYLNPGSVSLPKEHSVHGYLIYEAHRFVWKELSGAVVQDWTVDTPQVLP